MECFLKRRVVGFAGLFLLTMFSLSSAWAGSSDGQGTPRKSETGVEAIAPVGPGVPSRGEEATLDAIIGPNVRANSREICPSGRGITQSETAIASFGDDVVVAYNDTRG